MKKAKVGIITFSRSLNYGSALQAWALTKALEKLGAMPEIIDYEPQNYKDIYAIFRAPTKLKWIKFDLFHLLLLPSFMKRKRDFKLFWDKNYNTTAHTYKYGESLSLCEKEYDCLICGSDQIWNTRAKDFDIQYMFPDTPGQYKASYAVSINSGTLTKGDSKEKYRQLLSDFNYLSVREPNGRQQLLELLGEDRDISVCLDPTLLLNEDDYSSIMSMEKLPDRYIFFYSVKLKKDSLQSAKMLSRKTGLPVYTLVSGKGSIHLLKYLNIIKIPKGNIGPERFISLIKNASYVITDSFHGTAFSVIMHKPFCAISHVDPNGKKIIDPRINTLLNITNLCGQYVTADKAIDAVEDNIDWAEVDDLRSTEIVHSIDYLNTVLDSCK